MCAGLPDHDEPTNYYEILYNLGHNSLDNRGKLALSNVFCCLIWRTCWKKEMYFVCNVFTNKGNIQL